MNEDDLRTRLRELGTKSASKCESLTCEASDVALEEGTKVLMRKIRRPYIFGGPIFERSRNEGQLIRILQSLGLVSSEEEGREALHLMTNTELPYSHDRYGDAMFRLSFDDRTIKYVSELRQVDHKHPGCQRLHANYWD